MQVRRNQVIWVGGNRDAPFDVWFHPAFGDWNASFRHAFKSKLAACARVFACDPPDSRSRRVVLVGHSMAGMIASETAARLRKPPMLVIGVKTNLTRSDAYFTGLAAQFDDPKAGVAISRP